MDGKDKRILMVEDDPEIRGLLARFLEREGYDVLVAVCGEESLSLSRRRTPDMVLVDLNLPGINGGEVCRKLREEGSTRAVPILAISGQSSIETELEALQEGADDFVSKPFHLSELKARIDALFRRSEGNALQPKHAGAPTSV